MGGCLPIIAWADCITVTIGRPRATAFPPSLIYICAPFRRKRHGVEWLGPKAPVRQRKQSWANGAPSSGLGEKKSRHFSRDDIWARHRRTDGAFPFRADFSGWLNFGRHGS